MATMSPAEPEGQYRGALPWAIGVQDIATGFWPQALLYADAAAASVQEQKKPSRSAGYYSFSMRQHKCESLKQKIECKCNDSEISAPISRLFLRLWALYFVQSPSRQLMAQIMSARPDPGMQLHLQILDRLRQEMDAQSRWASAQAEFKPLRKTGELTASPRAKQTHRMWLRGCWIPLSRIQC